MPQRSPDFVFEPAEHLHVAVRALARLKTQVPADTPAAHYVKVTLAACRIPAGDWVIEQKRAPHGHAAAIAISTFWRTRAWWK